MDEIFEHEKPLRKSFFSFRESNSLDKLAHDIEMEKLGISMVVHVDSSDGRRSFDRLPGKLENADAAIHHDLTLFDVRIGCEGIVCQDANWNTLEIRAAEKKSSALAREYIIALEIFPITDRSTRPSAFEIVQDHVNAGIGMIMEGMEEVVSEAEVVEATNISRETKL
ncbi:uncharacterized protein V1513DRAFT_461755 [Lipomyces chichibuensis]|uniref:uncharacterized protein n=1 Tax=Lipomyces chichibuensis TaxID=1546026 RepID=UPI003343B9A9